MKIIIVGAGIVGLSVAHVLVELGCQVTVFDAGDVPNPSSASYDRSRMMRVQYGTQRGYAVLAAESVTAWLKLQSALGLHLYHETGACVWPGTASVWTRATSVALSDAGLAHEKVSPDVSAPRFLNPTALGAGVYTRGGGFILADRAITALATTIARRRAVVQPRTPILAVDADRGFVWTADGVRHEADKVIIAAGAWIAKLFPDFVNRTKPVRSIVVYVTAPPEMAAVWASAPCTMIETQESMLYALPPVSGVPLKLAGSANLRVADPDRPEPVSAQEAQAVLDAFRPYVLDIDRYRIVGNAVGYYADPPDKRFIVEQRNRVVIVSGCGGRMFKFAPLLAADIAAVIGGDTAEARLNRWTHPGS